MIKNKVFAEEDIDQANEFINILRTQKSISKFTTRRNKTCLHYQK